MKMCRVVIYLMSRLALCWHVHFDLWINLGVQRVSLTAHMVTCASLFCYNRWCPCITHCLKRRKATANNSTWKSISPEVLYFIYLFLFCNTLFKKHFTASDMSFSHRWNFFLPLISVLHVTSVGGMDEIENVYLLTINVLWVYQGGGVYVEKVSK